MQRRRGAPSSAAVALTASALLASAGDARAFCRTTTCPLPPDFSPTADVCYPANFASFCASLSPPAKPLAVWWRNACVGYDLQKNASKQIAYNTVAQIVSNAFAKWTATTCADSANGTSRVSIDVRDLGPVDCDQVQYNSDHGNQHVIIFRDDTWPHNDANNTLGLTTVTFDPDTGEIYDADMEINATVPLSVAPTPGPQGYDFESIITHETGHFLGMAHSGDERATMFAHYTQGSTSMRLLTNDDVSGLCAIYSPGGVRNVDPTATADGSGKVSEQACDPTPRHGFSSECKAPPSKACAVAGESAGARGDGSSAPPGTPALFALALLASSWLSRLVARTRPRADDARDVSVKNHVGRTAARRMW